MLGVSVVICCYNSAKLLPATLEHLKAQRVPSGLEWEVIVVDNASTDNTADVARSCWSGCEKARLTVLREPRLGLINARWCGLTAAKYEIVSFVDDDNWVASDWITVASEVLSRDLSVGEIGPFIDPVFGAPPPGWFGKFSHYYAIMNEQSAYRESPTSWISGAGSTLRRTAWKRLVARGFTPSSVGRMGVRLSGHDDAEMTFALRALGYLTRIEPRLRLQHFLPESRLTWSYLRRLARGYGASRVTVEAYMLNEEVERRRPRVKRTRWWRTWWWQLLATVRWMLLSPRCIWAWLFSRLEGDWNVIQAESDIGRVIGLLELRSAYTEMFFKVRQWLAAVEAARR